MFATIINDCRDNNEMGRQAARFGSYLNASVHTLGIQNDIEGAGNLTDILDSMEGAEGVVSLNVAPRSRRAHDLGEHTNEVTTLFATDEEKTDSLKREKGIKKWPNGTPFGYFYYKKTLVISTIDGYCLSMVKKYGITSSIEVFDIPTVIDFAIGKSLISSSLRSHIVDSQFRSNEFVPRAARWLLSGVALPSEKMDISTVATMPPCVWWVDNFGNSKTSLWASELPHVPGEKKKLTCGELQCYARLKDVPNGEGGITVGSSGFSDRRLLEIVIQGKRASDRYGLHSGFALRAY